MVRKHLLLTNEQDRFLGKLSGNASEHIRRAIDEYIERHKNMDATTSPKTMKILQGGEEVSL